MGICLISGKGKKISAPIELNSTWTIAKAMAASVLYMAAITAVMVVPILAPMMNGKDFAKLTRRFATRGTTRQVVTVLDCTAAVKNIP